MRIKYYFNGNYLIKGVKLFGYIVGKVLYSSTAVFKPGERVKVKSETFSEVSNEMVKTLKDFGYLSSLEL